MGAARLISMIALASDNIEWKKAAIPELTVALNTDITASDLLMRLILIDLSLNRNEQAQFYYDRFKLVARRSPLIELVAKSHQQGSRAVAADP